MSYVGLVPCESTTGKPRRLGAITKTGSGHARRLLVEAAWYYRARPNLGRALSDRQELQLSAAIAIAWSAQRRLHRTWTRLEARAQRRTIIAVAAARELTGFCSAITHELSIDPKLRTRVTKGAGSKNRARDGPRVAIPAADIYVGPHGMGPHWKATCGR